MAYQITQTDGNFENADETRLRTASGRLKNIAEKIKSQADKGYSQIATDFCLLDNEIAHFEALGYEISSKEMHDHTYNIIKW